MDYLLLLIPLGVVYYTITYGAWAWKKGLRRGAVGVYALAAFTLALSVYAVFFRQPY